MIRRFPLPPFAQLLLFSLCVLRISLILMPRRQAQSEEAFVSRLRLCCCSAGSSPAAAAAVAGQVDRRRPRIARIYIK